MAFAPGSAAGIWQPPATQVNVTASTCIDRIEGRRRERTRVMGLRGVFVMMISTCAAVRSRAEAKWLQDDAAICAPRAARTQR
jgi:hypothetical protein